MKTFLCAASFFALSIAPVPAQTMAPATPRLACAPMGVIAKQLASKFHEEPVAFGLQADGRMLQFYASEKGTWTALVVRPDGWTCIAAFGKGWQMQPITKKDPLA